MSTKKIVGIAIACLLLIITGISGVYTAQTLQEFTVPDTEELLNNAYGQDIAMINIIGTIDDTGDDISSVINGTYRHDATVDQIKDLTKNNSNKGILLYLNTPGGGVLESDEVYLALMEYKEATGRPVYAYMDEMAASGGYYISCAADTIICNRNGLTGSLGVILGYTDMTGLYEKLGIEQNVYTSGPFKSVAPDELKDDEDAIYQSLVDESYEQFVNIIATGRNMSDSQVRELADGRLYSATQALDNNLIDVIGSFDDAVSLIYDETGYSVNHYPLYSNYNFFDQLFARASAIIPKSDTQALLEVINNTQPMELYYVLQN